MGLFLRETIGMRSPQGQQTIFGAHATMGTFALLALRRTVNENTEFLAKQRTFPEPENESRFVAARHSRVKSR